MAPTDPTTLPEGVYRRGGKLWIRFTAAGHKYREPVTTTSPKKAAQRRIDRIAEVKRGESTPEGRTLTVGALLDLVVTDYTVNGYRSATGTRSQLEAVRAVLGTVRAEDVTTAAIQRMQAAWLAAGASAATVNRRCDKLRRGFRLAQQGRRLHLVPHVPRLNEPKRRGRYIRTTDLTAFATHLPAYVVPLVRFALLNGTRRGQLARTQRRFVDLERALIEWPPDEVKADEPHTVPLEGEALALVRAAMKNARMWCPYLFHGPRCAAGRAPSKRYGCVGDFKKAWATAMERAGFPVGRKAGGYVFHHTRNTAATDMRAAGMSTDDIMDIANWKTTEMVRRYQLQDLEALRARLEAARGARRATVRRLRG
jgi:integrase